MVNWAGFIPAALLVSLIPGANQLLGLSNAVRHGTAYAMAGIGGRLAAFVVLIGLVVGGLGAALLPQFTGGVGGELNTQIAVLGAAYLLIELVVGLGYVGLGSRIGATGIRARTQRRVDLASGACFVGLAGLLAADEVT